jgi:hypothetical protein
MHVSHSGALTGERIVFMFGIRELVRYMSPPPKTEALQTRVQNETTVSSETTTTLSSEYGNLLIS